MSNLLDLQAQLQDTSEAIAKSEQALASQPASGPAKAMLRSFEKRRQALEERFFAAASLVGTDLCSYRFFSDGARPSLSPICGALIDFQALYSLAYDAIKTGPKRRSRKVPQDVVDETSFSLGYTFSGSVGVVLTFDNRRLELFGTALDESMQAVASLASAKTSADILQCGRLLGVPAVRAAHKWASTHVASSLGAEIGWRKGKDVLLNLFLEPGDFSDLVATINNTTETIEEDIEVEGRLVGADVQRRTFHLILPTGEELRGNFSSSISPTQTFEVGRTYNTTLKRKVKVYYATEEEEGATYQLLMAAIA